MTMNTIRRMCAIALVLTACAVYAQVRTKRLILKDGSYQVVTQYEVRGDRVRYKSAEREGDWEEVPKSLVDWPATETWEKDHAPGAQRKTAAAPELKALDQEEQAERAREAAQSPEVAPGLRLPPQGGVFLLDTFRGQPELVELAQTNGEIDRQTGRNMLRAAINPLAGNKAAIELPKAHAAAQMHVDTPELYIDVDPDASNAAGGSGAQATAASPDRFKIIPLQPKKNARIVGSVKTGVTGKVSQQLQNAIPVRVERVQGGPWLKLTPAQPLGFGEYALVETLGPNEINSYVWDFGVNPRAPESPNAWKTLHPGAHSSTRAGDALGQRAPK